MMTLSEVIEHHRRIRDTYMGAARFAWFDLQAFRIGRPLVRDRKFMMVVAATIITNCGSVIITDPEGAMRCFVRRAREANRRLLSIKSS